MIKLGQKVRETVTGFQGVAVARTEWLSGCNRVSVQPPVDKDGRMLDAQAFDELTLEVVEDTPVVNPTPQRGGPRDDPKPPRTPPR